MNKHLSIHRLFLIKLTRDLFAVSFFFWLLFIVLEILKKGIVSNYFSLPHFAFVIALFALAHLAIRPAAMIPEKKRSRLKPWQLNVILSVLITVLLALTIDASPSLLLLLIFVTVATLWVVMEVVRE